MNGHIPPGIHTIRGIMGVCHLLVDESRDAVLLDTGLVGEPLQLKFLLWRLGHLSFCGRGRLGQTIRNNAIGVAHETHEWHERKQLRAKPSHFCLTKQ